MDKIGKIEIRVVGNKGSLQLSPDNYDIKEIAAILQNVEDILYPSNKKDRPIISYDIEEGSVKHVFKTILQAVIGFSAVINEVENSKSIDFLELRTAQALENIQQLSYQKNYSFEFSTSISNDPILRITPNTKFIRTENVWVDAELYYYGILTNAGGKSKANIHLDTEEFGSLTIDTKKEFLELQNENLLYKKFGVRVNGKQNLDTGEVDKSSFSLIELIDYDSKFDESYLNSLILKANAMWKGIDPDAWLTELRGDYEA